MTATINGDQNGTVGLINTMTAKATTSGTAIDFTGIPAGVKRITVMLNGVSTNGTSLPLVQLGSGSVVTTGYTATSSRLQDSSPVSVVNSAAGFLISSSSAANVLSGSIIFTNLSGNIWVAQGVLAATSAANFVFLASGNVTLSGALDRVRLTTVNGTDTFDAGSANILYE